MYYFYILKSLKNGKLYLGFSPDLKARFLSHNRGQNQATKPNIPYKLIHYQAFEREEDAIAAEKYYKTTSGWKRIHKMLRKSLE